MYGRKLGRDNLRTYRRLAINLFWLTALKPSFLGMHNVTAEN